MHPRRLRRLRNFDYTGSHKYSLTITAFQHFPLFQSAEVVNCVVAQILRASDETGYAVLAYCPMPDHFHALVDAQQSQRSLPDFVKRAKQLSGFHAKRIAQRRIWQAGYWDDILSPVADWRDAARYIVRNPVEAGLVTDAWDYPHSGSGIYSREKLFDELKLPRPASNRPVPGGG